MAKVTLLTPTGARYETFALCEQYMARQTYTGELEWIVVDDCDPATLCTMGQTVLRPEPRWPVYAVQNTHNRNLICGLAAAKGDFVIMIEDDDWYHPEYVQWMSNHLEKEVAVGEVPSRYYNVRFQALRVFDNYHHASLCQTGFHRERAMDILDLCRKGSWIDIGFWKKNYAIGKLLHGDRVVGIKGLPGRPGTTKSHTFVNNFWQSDVGLGRLQQWIGSDVENYRRFCHGRRV